MNQSNTILLLEEGCFMAKYDVAAYIWPAYTGDEPRTRMFWKEGMGEWDALRAITIDAARICRLDARLGSLKEGKDADIAIYDGNPLEIASSVKYTIVNGEIAWQSDFH